MREMLEDIFPMFLKKDAWRLWVGLIALSLVVYLFAIDLIALRLVVNLFAKR
jgi:uncharacterized membrane protein